MSTTQNATPAKVTMQDLIARIAELEARIVKLEATPSTPAKVKTDTKEMTDDDARSILFGDLMDVKHKDAAEKLGLTYGQVYSCRLGFTFKAIHKEMKDSNKKSQWNK